MFIDIFGAFSWHCTSCWWKNCFSMLFALHNLPPCNAAAPHPRGKCPALKRRRGRCHSFGRDKSGLYQYRLVISCHDLSESHSNCNIYMSCHGMRIHSKKNTKFIIPTEALVYPEPSAEFQCQVTRQGCCVEDIPIRTPNCEGRPNHSQVHMPCVESDGQYE